MKIDFTTSELQEVKAFLAEYNNFSECIIEKLAFTNYGTSFEVQINYIWSARGHLRANLNEPYTITLKFQLVQQLHLNNALTVQMLETPEAINWGISEVALVQLIEDSTLVRGGASLMHLAFLWEGERRIDVVFSRFEAHNDQVFQP